MNSKLRKFCLQACLIVLIFISSPYADDLKYEDRLFTPTQVVKLFDTYFIVDCWHHRILYSMDMSLPISKWKLLDDNLAGPHSIASNGNLYVTEDTGRHAIKVYKKLTNQTFKLVQTIPSVGTRPHRVLYDSSRKQFLVIGANDQSIHIFKENQGKLTSVFNSKFHEPGNYCRSITIKDDHIYFVCSSDILIYELKKHTIGKMIKKIKLAAPYHGPEGYHGPNDLFFINNNSGYLTSTPGKIFSFEQISELENGTATDLSHLFEGTPYYLEIFDNKLWIPENTASSGINSSKSMILLNLKPKYLKIHKDFDFGEPIEADFQRRSELPT
jgi:hypothetical protein